METGKYTESELEYIKAHPITDVHDMSHRGTPSEERKHKDIGDIYLNAATCKRCDCFVRSRNKYDYSTCRCGSLSVDGGSFYAKRAGDPHDYIDHIELYDDANRYNDE